MKILISRTPAFLLSLCLSVSVLAQSMVFHGRVIEVIDGTTITILTRTNSEFRVTCRSIEAPETQSSAAESRQRLANQILGHPVTIEYSKTDQNGKVIGVIRWNDTNICLEQVKAGLALYDQGHAGEQSASDRRIYSEAQSIARYQHAGIWNVISADNSNGLAERSPSTAAAPGATTTVVSVRGYFRKDGTYVAPRRRSAPDNSFDNNWSTQGNVNPFTGQPGTKKQSRWKTTLKWIGVGAALGALIYLDSRYPTPPAGASAICNDGTYSFSQHRGGTCSWHGGVRRWLY